MITIRQKLVHKRKRGKNLSITLKKVSKYKEESKRRILKLINVNLFTINTMSIITSWKIDGETVETVADFIFLGSKITADGDCSHEIKRCLTPWKESYDQPR